MELCICPASAPSCIEYLTISPLTGLGLGQENTCPATAVVLQASVGSIPHFHMDFGDILSPIGAAVRVFFLVLGAVPGVLLHVVRGCVWIILWIIAPVVLAAISVIFAVLRFILSPLLIPWRMAVFCYTVCLEIYDELEARTTSHPSTLRCPSTKHEILTWSTQPLIAFVSPPSSLHQHSSLTPP